VSLNAKQRLFSYEYVKDFNATKAAQRCGYSKKTARQQGTRLLSKAAIKAAIKKLTENRIDKAIMDRDEILRELTIIGRSDLKDYFDILEGGEIRAKMFDEMPHSTSRALKSIKETRTIRESADGKDTSIVTDKIEFELHPKVQALEKLGQHFGLFPTKIEGKLEVEARLTMADFKKSMQGLNDGSGSRA
jgi:phage terminase small subunit